MLKAMDKGKASQRLKGILIILGIVLVLGLMTLAAVFITNTLFGPLW